jgi:hypothetical protein
MKVANVLLTCALALGGSVASAHEAARAERGELVLAPDAIDRIEAALRAAGASVPTFTADVLPEVRLAPAIAGFQRGRGLDVTSALDVGTLHALGLPIEVRIDAQVPGASLLAGDAPPRPIGTLVVATRQLRAIEAHLGRANLLPAEEVDGMANSLTIAALERFRALAVPSSRPRDDSPAGEAGAPTATLDAALLARVPALGIGVRFSR